MTTPAQKTRSVDEKGEPVSLGQYNGVEIYPMPMFATVTVADVITVADWYVRALGFRVVFQAPVMNGQPAIVHLRRRKYQDVLLVPGNAAATGSGALMISFHAEDVEELAVRSRAVAAVGASTIEGPVSTPWNTRDLRVSDPAGNRLVFTGHDPNANPEQVERMRKMLEAERR
jgi:uncharacterized glyoxalase superfamily protein PhnB